MENKKVVNGAAASSSSRLNTRIVKVDTKNQGQWEDRNTLEKWVPVNDKSLDPLKEAADHLKKTAVPIAFPTETVYGLGADATRSEAVKGIYSAKGRPSDNPLIVHVCDLTMLRTFVDEIPAIYVPLIKKFWPGPLTILLPNATPSRLAKEVTGKLPNFGARMPDSPLALSLIHLAGVPLAAPSANASTKPSCTTAQHVLQDLDGKIEIILDGGACQVGVESTVVDGLCTPPVVLRPGGVSIDLIRQIPGWEKVVNAYKDASEVGTSAPRAPGMKYKHYSPTAKVLLYESSNISGRSAKAKATAKEATPNSNPLNLQVLKGVLGYMSSGFTTKVPSFGIVCTKYWKEFAGLKGYRSQTGTGINMDILEDQKIKSEHDFKMTQGDLWFSKADGMEHKMGDVIQIELGEKTTDIAHGLFSALRELDQRKVDVIFVEGIEDEGDIAAAVMNRLRKAASEIYSQK